MIRRYTADEALTLPALPGLLDGWCGPVEARLDFGSDGVVWTEPRATNCNAISPPSRSALRLPLSRPEARYRVACWLAMGERCFAVQPEGYVCANGWRNQPAGLGCQSCHGTGYLRAPAPLWWALSPGPSTLPEWVARTCLHASALRVGAGMTIIQGVERPALLLNIDGASWGVNGISASRRFLVEAEACEQADVIDATALAAGYVLLDGDTLRAEVPDE